MSSSKLPISFYDTSLHVIPDPKVTLSPFDSIRSLVGWTKPATSKDYFPLGNYKKPPHNFFVDVTDIDGNSDLSHVVWGIYGDNQRITPGDYQPSVMWPWLREGHSLHTYSKQDIETFRDAIRLPLSAAFISSSTTLLTNNIPWSKRMNSDNYNAIFSDSASSEKLPADYMVQNDSGAALTIHLGSDTTLMDQDGDTLSVYPGSLVNFRGCGTPGNNHDLLELSNSNRTITFRPRHNFWGRAQFGFNLSDNKEKGGFVVYTIDVTKGNNVSAPKGNNLVVNGDFEAGSEVKTLTDSLVNNTHIDGPMLYAITGRLNVGTHLADGYPYSCNSNYVFGTCIRGSYHENSEGVLPTFGIAFSSFPWSWPASSISIWPRSFKPEKFPDAKTPVSGTNNRYQPLSAGGLLVRLADTLKQCKRYVIEFDAIHTYKPGSSASGGYTYPTKDSLTLGFTNSSLVNGLLATPWPGGSKSFRTDSISTSDWQHFKFSFGYCGSETIDMIQLRFASAMSSNEFVANMAIDNISIVETDLVNAIKITDSASGGCKTYLLAGPPSTGCPSMTYEWKNASGTVVSTNRVLPVITWDTTFYSVSVSDGCSSAKDTFRIVPCSCSPAKVFKTSSYTPLSGSISGSLAPGYYHARGDLSLSSSLTFDNVQMLMEPGVKISVPATALLTLDSSHLFVCPDTSKLWKGIDLLSGGGYSGRINIKSHSLIEDADTAVRAVNPQTPSSGYIVRIDSAVFNRNVVSLLMDNYTAVTSDTTYPVLVQNAAFVSRKFTKTGSTYPLSWPDYYSLRAPISNGAKPPFAVHNDYDPVWTKNGKSAVAAIMLRNIGTYSGGSYYGVRIGNVDGTLNDSLLANLFDNTSAGIYAERTNLLSWNNCFINMQYIETPATGGFPPPSRVYYRGCGIFASSSIVGSGQYRIGVVQPPGVNGKGVNKFFDCATGISVEHYSDIYVQSCRIAGSNTISSQPAYTGVGVKNNLKPYNRLIISNNTMGNVVTAISVAQNVPSANRSTRIELNTLSATHPWMSGGSTSGQYMQQGISVQGIYSTPALTPADTALIASNNMTGVYNGIDILNMSAIRALLDGNTIGMALSGTAKAQYGISVSNTQKATIQNNTLTGDGSTKSSDKVRAVYATFNTDLRVCVNSTTNIGRGFDFSQTRAQTGTRWYGNSMNKGTKGFILGSDLGNLNSEIDYMTHVPPLTYGAGLNTWSGYGGGTSFETFGEYLRDTRLSKLYVRPGFALEYPINRSGYPTTAPYIYDTSSLKLTDYTSSCLGSSHFPSHYYPLTNVRSVGPTLAMLVVADSLGYGQDGKPSQWMAQQSVYEAGLIDPSLSDSFPTFASFMLQAAGSRFGWVTSVQQALADGDVTTAAGLIGSRPSATGFIAVDTNVSITDYNEADTVVDNYAAYFSYYLDYLTGTFSDTGGLQLLALKCPAIDGAVVYQARTLFNIVNDIHVVYDDDSCSRSYASSYYRIGDKQKADGNATYTLYPNPNGGSFRLTKSVSDDESVPVKVYNALGMVIYAANLTFNNGMADIRLNNTAPGVYLACIGNGQNVCLRFVVY